MWSSSGRANADAWQCRGEGWKLIDGIAFAHLCFGVEIKQALILCGGKGTRLGDRVRTLPKPLIPVGGRPVLDHIIDALSNAGISEFILAAGYLGEAIARYYAAHPRAGCKIEVVIEPAPLGTAGALRFVSDLLRDDFVLAYGDVFVDFNIGDMVASHLKKRPLGTLLVRASDHPWDSHLVDESADGRVLEFIGQREPGRLYRNVANAAFYVLNKKILAYIPSDRASDFGADIFPAVIRSGGELRTYFLPEEGFTKDMGTPDRLASVERYLRERALAREASAKRSRVTTVLLDRDGVLNVDSGLIDREERLELLPGAGKAVAILNEAGITCFVITNQPVIARGLCSEQVLAQIHARLIAGVAADGGRIESIYYCPHHPETHHREGIPELRRGCRCRKPAAGLIFQAQREHGFDLSGAIMVGDRETDVRAGRAAGLRTVLIAPQGPNRSEGAATLADAQFPSLLAFAEAIVSDRVFNR